MSTSREKISFGDLLALKPFTQDHGFSRGLPIDRVYIEDFLCSNKSLIKGRCLEFLDDGYLKKFGGDRVLRRDVMDLHNIGPWVTYYGDLTKPDCPVPRGVYDCIVATQVLQVIYDQRAALRTLYDCLEPGGVLLATVNGIAQTNRIVEATWPEQWRMTNNSAFSLFSEVFGEPNVCVHTYGNCLTAIVFLMGLSVEDLLASRTDSSMDVMGYQDPDYQVLITIKAVKA